MGNTIKQDYSYAFDESDTLINVGYASRSCTYYCPCCGEIMIPHMGKVRRWHFTHKSVAKCN
ncbi:MAG: competence protein CoiA family protein, partial [Candidatus Limisoma sp.]|nr:competence protein CoiA family protein [Candidatus Limisoma sp.]